MRMFAYRFMLRPASRHGTQDEQASRTPAKIDRARSAHRPFRLARLWKALASDAHVQPSRQKPGL